MAHAPPDGDGEEPGPGPPHQGAGEATARDILPPQQRRVDRSECEREHDRRLLGGERNQQRRRDQPRTRPRPLQDQGARERGGHEQRVLADHRPGEGLDRERPPRKEERRGPAAHRRDPEVGLADRREEPGARDPEHEVDPEASRVDAVQRVVELEGCDRQRPERVKVLVPAPERGDAFDELVPESGARFRELRNATDEVEVIGEEADFHRRPERGDGEDGHGRRREDRQWALHAARVHHARCALEPVTRRRVPRTASLPGRRPVQPPVGLLVEHRAQTGRPVDEEPVDAEVEHPAHPGLRPTESSSRPWRRVRRGPWRSRLRDALVPRGRGFQGVNGSVPIPIARRPVCVRGCAQSAAPSTPGPSSIEKSRPLENPASSSPSKIAAIERSSTETRTRSAGRSSRTRGEPRTEPAIVARSLAELVAVEDHQREAREPSSSREEILDSAFVPGCAGSTAARSGERRRAGRRRSRLAVPRRTRPPSLPRGRRRRRARASCSCGR